MATTREIRNPHINFSSKSFVFIKQTLAHMDSEGYTSSKVTFKFKVKKKRSIIGSLSFHQKTEEKEFTISTVNFVWPLGTGEYVNNSLLMDPECRIGTTQKESDRFFRMLPAEYLFATSVYIFNIGMFNTIIIPPGDLISIEFSDEK
jgi:hypothetical protein